MWGCFFSSAQTIIKRSKKNKIKKSRSSPWCLHSEYIDLVRVYFVFFSSAKHLNACNYRFGKEKDSIFIEEYTVYSAYKRKKKPKNNSPNFFFPCRVIFVPFSNHWQIKLVILVATSTAMKIEGQNSQCQNSCRCQLRKSNQK